MNDIAYHIRCHAMREGMCTCSYGEMENYHIHGHGPNCQITRIEKALSEVYQRGRNDAFADIQAAQTKNIQDAAEWYANHPFISGIV